jgi:DNA-binding response OmpR family regulator
MKIIIIEDDLEIISSVSLIIKMMWPDCVIISSGLGNEGIDLVCNEKPDAVILDLGLPDMSGFGVLKQIRIFSSIPILILTVHDDEKDIVKGIEMELGNTSLNHLNRWNS